MEEKFLFIDKWLSDNQALWRFEPFHQSLHVELPWKHSHPEMCDWLQSLSQAELLIYKSSPERLSEQLQSFVPFSDIMLQSIAMPSEPVFDSLLVNATLESRFVAGIPGRKLTQIAAMGEYCLRRHRGSQWLEWCSGKGYLGRLLSSQSRQAVTSFEFQQALCDSGQSEADHLDLPMTFVQGDAFDNAAKQHFLPSQHAVALHACGDLHVKLMHYGCERGLAAMTIAPCCYHLIQAKQYQPQSELAKRSELTLSKNELRIPLQQTVTGGERVHRHRQQEMTYRLGLDLILRQECGYSDYISIPSIKKSQLSEGFKAFCFWALTQKAITLPDMDFEHYESLGNARFWQMERLSLVQQHFQRAIEMWLVYDKALYLQQQGYEVRLSEFCERHITPRNVLIHACKRESC